MAAFRHEGVFRHKGVLPRAICIQLALAPTQFTQPGPGRQHPQDMLGRLACDCQVAAAAAPEAPEWPEVGRCIGSKHAMDGVGGAALGRCFGSKQCFSVCMFVFRCF